ncbi:DUF2332 domain-containing protein [Nonomuraea sp. NPDC050643]|uniref:DUF2332 domain-containing protein n=1 Tax=Nonomuraea sp. NPDC050643 TaxID=3155660 RepID=UPI0034073CD0
MPPEGTSIAEQYRRFASVEARGASPLYQRLALGVAGDDELLGLLAGLPPAKRQPNLLFAAGRHVNGTPDGYDAFRRDVLGNRDAVVATMLSRSTQTNEPARCAALYPLLAALPQPLALLEVGASAGLCLLPDRYGYDYDGHLSGALNSPLRLHCHVTGAPGRRVGVDPKRPVDGDPERPVNGGPGSYVDSDPGSREGGDPESREGGGPRLPGPDAVTVVWRAGIDLNPLDVTDPDDVHWLRTLVWPEQHDRLHRLDTAIAIARTAPPRIVRGDLNARLAEVAAQAPSHATLVVFHTAVLWYLPAEDRATFAWQVERLDGHWISQEAPEVFPGITARLPRRPSPDTALYVLALDGRPLAVTAMHGGRQEWLA